MTRTVLPSRRPAWTRSLEVELGGRPRRIVITVGFEVVQGPSAPPQFYPREVFCADFKAGTEMHAIVMDACVLLSRLLQHGDSAAELARTLSQPPSLIGRIAAALDGPWDWGG